MVVHKQWDLEIRRKGGSEGGREGGRDGRERERGERKREKDNNQNCPLVHVILH